MASCCVDCVEDELWDDVVERSVLVLGVTGVLPGLIHLPVTLSNIRGGKWPSGAVNSGAVALSSVVLEAPSSCVEGCGNDVGKCGTVSGGTCDCDCC